LAKLIELPGDFRIRMSSLHPAELTDELLAVWTSSPKVMPHLHLSLQSGSDLVLEQMGRGYTADEYAAAVERARAALAHRNEINTESLVGPASYIQKPVWSRHEDTPSRIRDLTNGRETALLGGNDRREWQRRPTIFDDMHGNPAITTDVIVGFPGETNAEFEETFEFCKRIGFSRTHIFTFSPRPGTRAAELPDAVSPDVAHERHQRLAALADEMTAAFHETFIGKTVHVLVEHCKNGTCTGGSEHYVPVQFSGSADLIGTVVSVTISEANAEGVEGVATQ